MIRGHWYCEQEKKNNAHVIVGNFSICNCGAKTKLKVNHVKRTSSQINKPKEVRKELRSPYVRAHAPNRH